MFKVVSTTESCTKVCNFIKKRLQHKCFPVNIAKFLRAIVLKNIWEWLPLKNHYSLG